MVRPGCSIERSIEYDMKIMVVTRITAVVTEWLGALDLSTVCFNRPISSLLGVRHRTRRIARFMARNENEVRPRLLR